MVLGRIKTECSPPFPICTVDGARKRHRVGKVRVVPVKGQFEGLTAMRDFPEHGGSMAKL
jgi:hypothetical protein